MQEFGWRDDVEGGFVALQHLALALQRACDQGLSGSVVSVGEGDVLDAPRWRGGIDEDVSVPVQESSPFKVWGDT